MIWHDPKRDDESYFVMKYLIPVVLILVIWLLPAAARAQSALTLDQVQVGLWPEYDRSAMLVIYHIQLTADTQLHVDLVLRIPVAAGEPNAVAVLAENGLVNVDYELVAGDDWITVQFESDSFGVQLEYYDPGLGTAGPERTFTYTWPGDYDVQSMVIEVQRPAGAQDMLLEPAYQTAQPGNDGLTYYSRPIGALAAGETFSQTVTYSNPDDTLTTEILNEEAGLEPSVSNGIGFDWRWLLIFAALGLIGYGVYGMLGSKRKAKRQPKKPSKSKSGTFCHSCGAQAEKGDKYCRLCGTKLRSDIC